MNTEDKVSSNNQSLLLTNRVGGFLLLSHNPTSKYEGIFIKRKERVIKVIEAINLKTHEHPISLNYGMWYAEKKYKSNKEKYFIPFEKDVVVYNLEKEDYFDLILDVKESYDHRTWGRNYKITEEFDAIIIEFTKTTDNKEDNSSNEKEYTVYVAILKKDIKWKINDNWLRREYSLDDYRKSYPFERYVYNAIEIYGKEAIISYGIDKMHVIEQLHETKEHLILLKKEAEYHTAGLLKEPICNNEEHNLAYFCSVHAIDQLMVIEKSTVNFYAGLPWFFQYWSRDELISLKSLILSKRYDESLSIIDKYINSICPDGRIPNRIPYSGLSSADSIGWLFVRFEELLIEMNKDNVLDKYISEDTLKKYFEKLEISLNNLIRFYLKDDFIINKDKETWMDTDWNNEDSRNGVRIEIQALFLRMLRFMQSITGNFKYKRIEQDLKENIKTKMFKNNILADGLNDFTIRPNIFIAYYLYPFLLNDEEWNFCFVNALDKLWLEWGGFCTIDKTNKLFYNNYSGENNQSYHRGDSWYYINNLCSIAMHRLDKEKFKPYIDKILSASTKEILTMGTIGCHAEVSSAKEQKSYGCPAQLWSSALYIELLHQIYKN
jgi:hypothetical protein